MAYKWAMVSCIMLAMQFFGWPAICLAAKMEQFLIQIDGQAVCGKKIEGTVAALDAYGALLKEFEGNKTARWEVKEVKGKKENSFSITPGVLEFIKGKAIFGLMDSEPETLEISLSIDNSRSPFPATVTFIPQVASPQEALDDNIPKDTEAPYITEILMNVQSIVEVTFNEELDDAAATDPSNYYVICGGTSHRPRSAEFHGKKIILEMGAPLPEHSTMHIELKNIKDKAGNSVSSGNRSPSYDVPCCAAGS